MAPDRRFISLFLLLTFVLAIASLPFASASYGAPSLPFKFEYLFTATIDFGPPAGDQPIQITGGFRIPVPISGGSVEGPAANGTIISGTAYSQYYNNQTYEMPKIALYGTLADGNTPFFVQEEGVGTMVSHTTRIFLDVNGEEYDNLREGYILAHTMMAEDRRSLTAECYLVLDI